MVLNKNIASGAPLVSIIVPCYNQAAYLDACLMSVLRQTYSNWECLIIDDGSPDTTKDIAEKWTAKDSRFTYFYKANGGICETRNFGIHNSKGDYILPLDADDKIEPEYLKEAVTVLVNKSDVKLVYCNKVYFGEINRKDNTSQYSFERMLYENQIHHAAMYRKSDFLKTNGYNLTMYDGLEDWDFWLELLDPNDKVEKLEGYYYHYRIKKTSRSTEINSKMNERLILQMFRNHIDKYSLFFNPIRDHINHLHYKSEYSKLNSSKEMCVGKILCAPYNFIKKITTKIIRRLC